MCCCLPQCAAAPPQSCCAAPAGSAAAQRRPRLQLSRSCSRSDASGRSGGAQSSSYLGSSKYVAKWVLGRETGCQCGAGCLKRVALRSQRCRPSCLLGTRCQSRQLLHLGAVKWVAAEAWLCRVCRVYSLHALRARISLLKCLHYSRKAWSLPSEAQLPAAAAPSPQAWGQGCSHPVLGGCRPGRGSSAGTAVGSM